ncbi:unnamed protein product [Parnassius apollo]|uniref:(apollo) hypothetical protein n=1 Tax=Parnassius apollo TaxID=110799 RepID=A0A8S3Y0X7_PARAO|nr:unnamed protein product [Parnassius apollo]
MSQRKKRKNLKGAKRKQMRILTNSDSEGGEFVVEQHLNRGRDLHLFGDNSDNDEDDITLVQLQLRQHQYQQQNESHQVTFAISLEELQKAIYYDTNSATPSRSFEPSI